MVSLLRATKDPAILISMLLLHMLLHMRSTYVARIHFEFHLEWMQRTERNQIVRIWTVYYL